MNQSAPYHEQLFDEICGKLQELEHKNQPDLGESTIQNKLDKLHQQLAQNQEALLERIRGFDFLPEDTSDLSNELEKLNGLLDTERKANAKLSGDLARALDFNLKLQYDIEESKKRNKTLQDQEKQNALNLEAKVKEMESEANLLKSQMLELETAIDHFEDQSRKQSENIQSLTHVAEKKLIELKMALDKKTFEQQECMSQMQKMNSQMTVLRQENQTLREYIQRMTALHEKSANA